MLEPLNVKDLVKNIDYRGDFDTGSLDPSYDKVTFHISDKPILSDLRIPLELMKSRDRLLETDYGYALMDVESLLDWTSLSQVISDPMASKDFIEAVAKTPVSFPGGILPESAEWLRWSVFAVEESILKSMKDRPERNPLLETSIQRRRLLRAEYRRLLLQKEIFMFPFGVDDREEYDEMRPQTAQVVLATLARYFLLSKLYVKRPDGEYKIISEYLDKDSLMLMSRFPELLPSYPVFEGGHFSIEHENLRVGHDDIYSLSKRQLQEVKVKEDVSYTYSFTSFTSSELFEPDLEVDGVFLISFYNNDKASDTNIDLTKEEFESIFSLKKLEMEQTVERQVREFKESTGYNLPNVTVEEAKGSDYTQREFILSFGHQEVPNYIKAAFFVFLSKNI